MVENGCNGCANCSCGHGLSIEEKVARAIAEESSKRIRWTWDGELDTRLTRNDDKPALRKGLWENGLEKIKERKESKVKPRSRNGMGKNPGVKGIIVR